MNVANWVLVLGLGFFFGPPTYSRTPLLIASWVFKLRDNFVLDVHNIIDPIE